MRIVSQMEEDPLSAEDRRAWNDFAALIEDELTAQIAMGRLERSDGKRSAARIIADTIWRSYEMRPKG
jgi:hypothetical protein